MKDVLKNLVSQKPSRTLVLTSLTVSILVIAVIVGLNHKKPIEPTVSRRADSTVVVIPPAVSRVSDSDKVSLAIWLGISLLALIVLLWLKRRRFSPSRGFLGTAVLLVFSVLIFYVFMVRRNPGIEIRLRHFFNPEWREYFLFTSVFIIGLVYFVLAALLQRKYWWRTFGFWISLLIFLLIVGYRPISSINGTKKSFSAFQLISPSSGLIHKLNRANPRAVLENRLPKNKNDYTELFKVRKGDVIGVWAKGSIRYGRKSRYAPAAEDPLVKAIREGRAFATPETRSQLRDPSAHPFSPVLGLKSSRLGIVSAYKGGPGSPEQIGGALFFLLVTAEGDGNLYVFPSNIPKSKYFYGAQETEGFIIKIYHFPTG